MDAKDFNGEVPTEEAGSDVEEFIAILERMEAMTKLRRERLSGMRSKEGEKKIMGGSECGWIPCFEWEDFYERDRKSVSVTVKNANGDGGIKMQEQTRGFTQEVQGSIKRPNKRLRDTVESADNFSAERRPGGQFLPELKAEISDICVVSFDLNSNDEE